MSWIFIMHMHMFRRGVICLMSAAVYYNFTTYRPDVVRVEHYFNKEWSYEEKTWK